jgi:hypothetical protein
MSSFNKVFSVIKRHCEKQKLLAEIRGFAAIAKEANVPIDKLPVYLDHLQDMGLIKYSVSEQYIYLTSLGKKQDAHINALP